MKKFLKILGVSLLSVVIVLSAVFLPSLCKTSNTLKSTSASSLNYNTSLETYKYFYSSDIHVVRPGVLTSFMPIDNFSAYLISTDVNFTPFAIPFNFSLQLDDGYIKFGLRGGAEDYYYYGSSYNNDIFPYVYFSSFDIASLNSSFVTGGVNNRFVISYPVSMRSSSSGNLNTIVGYTSFGSQLFFIDTDNSGFVSPSLDIVSLEITNSYEFANNFNIEPSFSNSNIFVFTDTVGWKYAFYIPSPLQYDIYPSWYYTYRIYYFKSFFNFSDSSFYQQGLSDGYSKGLTDGESIGYSNGFEAGEISGYSSGYNQGLENANEYTFTALIGAVFDAPIIAFTSLFNFNILGFNVLSFLTSLLTLCVVIFILKLVLGGK